MLELSLTGFGVRGRRVTSPYTLSYAKQIQLCVWRGFRRLVGNPEITLTALIGEICSGRAE